MLHNRRDDIIGVTLYPSGTAGSGKVDVDKFTGVGDQHRCKQCGFICLESRVSSPGAANDGDGGVQNDPDTGDPIVGQGYCPFCGSANNRH